MPAASPVRGQGPSARRSGGDPARVSNRGPSLGRRRRVETGVDVLGDELERVGRRAGRRVGGERRGRIGVVRDDQDAERAAAFEGVGEPVGGDGGHARVGGHHPEVAVTRLEGLRVEFDRRAGGVEAGDGGPGDVVEQADRRRRAPAAGGTRQHQQVPVAQKLQQRGVAGDLDVAGAHRLELLLAHPARGPRDTGPAGEHQLCAYRDLGVAAGNDGGRVQDPPATLVGFPRELVERVADRRVEPGVLVRTVGAVGRGHGRSRSRHSFGARRPSCCRRRLTLRPRRRPAVVAHDLPPLTTVTVRSRPEW